MAIVFESRAHKLATLASWNRKISKTVMLGSASTGSQVYRSRTLFSAFQFKLDALPFPEIVKIKLLKA